MPNPKAKIDWKTLDAMLQFGPSLYLCAEQLGVSQKTILRHIREKFDQTFEEYKHDKMDKTRLKLQQKAVNMAFSGNATMMIFCLKNLCKWADKQEIEVEQNAPFVFNYGKKKE